MSSGEVGDGVRVIKNPNVKWAQRKDRVLLTVECQNCKEPKLDIDNDLADGYGIFTFAGEGVKDGEACTYDLRLDLYGELNKEESKVSVTDRKIVLVLLKSKSGPHWPRLLHAPGKSPPNIKVDWDLYMDEDDEEEEENKKNFDIGQLDDFSKFDDPLDKDIHTDSEDSDDEDLPDLVN
mmetsp:Transcript_7447/g.13791  ORF Transcript_7447/g.13791 Transcript_7447/m.13791 type:complete len:179 (+) Transcript_7447:220-756(+)|eukprot:CAMPEP_0197474010 /NCGR_PEP_ID=MMETSP1309-20131121/5453_1 /TAXON_ID=464262 /ORGANISM="Genus nov. species nov., Strain RCC998" /LENGTH=178 /DNA_ID=CAMNT_0043013443 /DNA_START=176 /DNA_END=712 /DNA_ORIENTATION=-